MKLINKIQDAYWNRRNEKTLAMCRQALRTLEERAAAMRGEK